MLFSMGAISCINFTLIYIPSSRELNCLRRNFYRLIMETFLAGLIATTIRYKNRKCWHLNMAATVKQKEDAPMLKILSWHSRVTLHPTIFFSIQAPCFPRSTKREHLLLSMGHGTGLLLNKKDILLHLSLLKTGFLRVTGKYLQMGLPEFLR